MATLRPDHTFAEVPYAVTPYGDVPYNPDGTLTVLDFYKLEWLLMNGFHTVPDPPPPPPEPAP